MRIVLCLLLAVDTGEPFRLFHVPQDTVASAWSVPIRPFQPSILTGALSIDRGIVKRVLLTSVGDFYDIEGEGETTRDAQRVRDRYRSR
ncbi:hypothetical protein AB0I00_27410 [Streptomyces sp. NPDC050803]|uniref:hypothetical protein n=1 Tax=unclassified Streptomyces TaxID=2593676 RepID=UPI003429F487